MPSFRCSDQRVRVRISGQEVPTVESGVTTEISNDAQKSGADITRVSEIYLPMSWKGEDITSGIQAFDPSSQSQYDKVTVMWQNVRNPNEWTIAHRGFLRGVSGAEPAGVARAIVSDPAALTTAISFSNQYVKPSLEKVFSDVLETFNENTVFNAELSMSTSRQISAEDEAVGVGASPTTLNALDANKDTFGQKSFKSNRHSIADALNWATGSVGGKWYFDTQGTENLHLVYDDGSGQAEFVQREKTGEPQEQQLNDQGAFPQCSIDELDIISNDALAELFPINTLTVKGATGASILGMDVSMVPAEKAPWVQVQYDPFVKRSGGNVVGETIETDNVTLKSAENKARKELEKRILDSGTGQIECYGNGKPQPYDTVVARPECNDVLTSSVNPLTHEIAKVTHEKPATKEMITFLDVSPVFDPSQVSVKTAEMRKV